MVRGVCRKQDSFRTFAFVDLGSTLGIVKRPYKISCRLWFDRCKKLVLDLISVWKLMKGLKNHNLFKNLPEFTFILYLKGIRSLSSEKPLGKPTWSNQLPSGRKQIHYELVERDLIEETRYIAGRTNCD